MNIPFFQDVVIIFGLAVAVILICRKLQIPTLVALLLTGVICGPQGLAFIKDAQEVEPLAELGIALLLFGIGIELSLARFLRQFRQLLVGGGLQVVLTLLLGFLVAVLIGRPLPESIFLGFLISLSSTAIVLTLLQEREEVGSWHGRLILSILIFQDMIVLPMLLLVPILAGAQIALNPSFFLLFLQNLTIMSAVLLASRWAVPKLLKWAAETRDNRLFLLTALFACFFIAWVSASLGLPLAFGAFLAGLIISESEYSTYTLGNIVPFQELFTCFFFISTGMLLQSQFILEHPILIFLCLIGIIVGKALIAGGVALLLGLSLHSAILVGFALCQVGEFSLLLLKSGIAHQISSPFRYQLFLSVTLFSMALAPLLINFAPRLIEYLEKKRWLGREVKLPLQSKETYQNHVILVGAKTIGRHVTMALKMLQIPYVIITRSPEQIQDASSVFGDATHRAVLRHVNIAQARALVIFENNKTRIEQILFEAKRTNPHIHTIVQSSDIAELKNLISLGANEVVPTDLEIAIETATRILRHCLIPSNEIQEVADELRAGEYEIFREPFITPLRFSDLNLELAKMKLQSFRVREKSALVGKSLAELNLRHRYGITLLVVRRLGEFIWEIDPNMTIKTRDILVLFGQPDKIKRVTSLF